MKEIFGDDDFVGRGTKRGRGCCFVDKCDKKKNYKNRNSIARNSKVGRLNCQNFGLIRRECGVRP